MKFSIITPTYKRKEKLTRAVDSVLSQTYKNWEMIIINDSGDDPEYKGFMSASQDPRICYYVNDRNRGVNFSRNRGLDCLSRESSWVIFLDDDDYLAPDTLATLHELINSHQGTQWFITNRAYTNGTPLTQFPSSDTYYSYAWSYLILKKCKGDATHCIQTNLVHKARFSKTVKQGEEWFFFYQVGLQSKMYYHDHNSTITDGYDNQYGLNYRKRTFTENHESLGRLFHEIIKNKILRISIVIYFLLRIVKLFFKKKNS